jgi:hypothetical protein
MWGSFNHKHWHREAVLTAIRDIDLTYDLRSFMRDLTWIRKQTFKESTIISAFRKAGIWPVSCNTALTKLRTYSRPTIQPVSTLPTQVTPKPSTFRGVEEGLQYWKTRVPEGFSSPSKESYRNFLTGTEEVVIGGQLRFGARLTSQGSGQARAGPDFSLEVSYELLTLTSFGPIKPSLKPKSS